VPITTKVVSSDPFRRGVLDATLYDTVCQLLATGWGFTQRIPVSSAKKNDRHDITEILLKVVLNTITLTTYSPPSPYLVLLSIVLPYHCCYHHMLIKVFTSETFVKTTVKPAHAVTSIKQENVKNKLLPFAAALQIYVI
jgi:hypothetical protein